MTQTPCHSGGTTSSLFFNRFYHIEDNVQLGWGESWGRKFLLLMLSYFGNLVAFCLILKFFLLSMVIKEKFSKWKGRNWIFVFSLDLEFVLCLLKLMNCPVSSRMPASILERMTWFHVATLSSRLLHLPCVARKWLSLFFRGFHPH